MKALSLFLLIVGLAVSSFAVENPGPTVPDPSVKNVPPEQNQLPTIAGEDQKVPAPPSTVAGPGPTDKEGRASSGSGTISEGDEAKKAQARVNKRNSKPNR
jgi:hypothetical protein